jgi:ABC-type branched-subunit amino acid transport system substrate-binding protein
MTTRCCRRATRGIAPPDDSNETYVNWKILFTAAAIAVGSAASAQTKGMSDNEITLGPITDLSGPVANYGKESRNGMTLALAEKAGKNLTAESDFIDPLALK